MKKILLFLCFAMSLTAPTFAADKIHVKALTEFDSTNPQNELKVEVIEDGEINEIAILKGSVINCTLEKIVDPKRAKQDAKIYLHATSYEDSEGLHTFFTPLRAKYSKTIISKEEVKKIPPKKIIKKTASTAGGFFIHGFSYGVSFVDGLIENNEDNRLKSAAKQVYDDSFLSLVEYGNDVVINPDDEFYLIISKDKDEQ